MEDLLRLYSFESVHGTKDEVNIFNWICKWLKEHNIPFETYEHNIYSINGSSVILSAHLDQVKTNGPAVRFYKTKENHIVAYNSSWNRTSLGADDKNGIWIILKLLEQGINIDFIISEGEECGCVGIKRLKDAGILSKISDKQFCLVLDRKGSKDTLTGGAGDTYNTILSQTIANFTEYFSPTTGSISDTRIISEFCESTNLSTGYYNPHTATEYTNWVELNIIKGHVENIVTSMVFYPTKPKKKEEVSVYKDPPSYLKYYNTGYTRKEYENEFDF